MDLLLKTTIVLIIILLTVLVVFPCKEYFQNASDILSSKSSVLYSNNSLKTDEDYLKTLNPISNDLLIMYRCIEFKKGGIEHVIASLKTENRFFISNKYETTYTDFSSIEELIKTSVLKLYDDSKQSFYGPIYLLITQYPLYNSVTFTENGCVTTNLSSPLENSFSPIVQNVDEKCGDISQKQVKCEFYILMPSHLSNNGNVGARNNDSWDTIAKNMNSLLVSHSSIINPRSQDKQCFTKCGEIQVDGYMCGARNSVNDIPYKSVVYNTPTNNRVEKTFSDYANLYILNTNGINNLLGKTIETTRIIEEGLKTQAVPLLVEIQELEPTIPESTTNDNLNIIPHIDRYDYEVTQKALREEQERLERQRQLEFMSDIQARCYLMRYVDLRNAFGSDIQRAKQHWIQYGIRENRVKECNEYLLNLVNGTTNGLTEDRSAPSAKHIMDVYGTQENGVYWINLPNVGTTQVYCIMDPACAGGGWMLAMKATQGNTFHYESDHWKQATTLNKNNPSRSNGDAKYDIFNHYKARDWFAGFPDVPDETGDISRNVYNGFTWVEHNAVNSEKTLLEVFQNNQRITKSRNPTGLNKFNKNVWSRQSPFQFYGMNYQGGHGFKSRWGFGWNENGSNNERSNDAGGGIGTQHASAGDRFHCCGHRGLNRPMRMEFYVR